MSHWILKTRQSLFCFILLGFLVGVLDPSLAKAKGGASIGGGGSFVWLADEYPTVPFLFDFVMMRTPFKEERGFATSNSPSIFTGQLNAESAILGTPIEFAKQAPETWALIQDRLATWKKNSPSTVELIRRVIETTQWRATLFELARRKGSETYTPEDSWLRSRKYRELRSGAVFRGYGVFIHAAFWDQALTGHTSRAGLIIHEALRSLQIELFPELDTQTIQILTTMIMLKEPSENTVDTLDGILEKRIGVLASTWAGLSFPAADQEELDQSEILGRLRIPNLSLLSIGDGLVLEEIRLASLGYWLCTEKREGATIRTYVSTREALQRIKSMAAEGSRMKNCEDLKALHFPKGIPQLQRIPVKTLGPG